MSAASSVLLALGLLGATVPAAAQAPPACTATREVAETKVVVPGPEYKAGALHRWLWGADYRSLWTTPIRVPVLHPSRHAGGLTAEGEGGGLQTRSLSLASADGREYRFRSVDKDPKRILPEPLRGTVAGSVLQDQTAGAVPGGAVVVGPLLDRVGVLNAPVQLFVMGDDEELGQFRQKFAGMLGTLEQVPGNGPAAMPGFETVDKVENSVKLFERLDEHPEEHVDSRDYLKARLVDLVVGDWDRHVLQWRWGRSRETGLWRPIPHDRDQAFTKYQGVALAVARPLAPRFTVYGPRYETIKGLMWDSRDLDRRLLTPLDWKEWQAAVAEIREKLDDATIRAAVCRLPPEHVAIAGRQLVAALLGRRDRLPEAARRFYLLLSEQADVFATEGDDVARIERQADGSVRLQVALAGSDQPWIDRSFRPGETREFRLYLLGGDDRVTSVGRGPMDVRVRVLGGDGNDVLDDSQGGGVRFYDTNGENYVRKGPGTKVDERQWLPPVTDPDDRPLDWGNDVGLVPWVSYYRDVGAFVGAGVQYTTYGFRQYPYAERHTLRGGFATAAGKWRLEYTGDFRLRGALKPRGEIEALVSGIEVLHFYGFGNQPTLTRPDSYYWVDQQQYILAPSLVRPIPSGTVTLGGDLRFARTDLQPGRFITTLRPYGVGSFGQAGLRAEVVYDVRDTSGGAAARKGLLLTGGGNYYPAVWSLRSAFGQARATAATYAPLPFAASLALRLGGQKVWGEYPFHDAAFIGSWDTVRGLPQNRYAGDASLFANAELRLPLPRKISVLSSNRIGLFALADAGRVFYRGENSRRWHRAFGGGTWMSFANGTRTFSAAMAHSEGNTGFYLYGGMLF